MSLLSLAPRGAALVAAAGLPACLTLACSRTAAPPPDESAAPAQAPSAAPAAPSPRPKSLQIERDGLVIDFDLLPRGAEKVEANTDATAAFTITSKDTGAPVRGLRPLAWMSAHAGAEPSPLDDRACHDQIKRFFAGLLSAQPEVDMNAYLLWTLNHDSTISVINPQLAFGRTKLLNLISLPGAPADWAMRPDRGAVYVTIPSEGVLSVVDARRSLAIARVPVGALPRRVVVDNDGKVIWVGNDGDRTVSVIDASDNHVLATLDVGKGHHEIALAEGGQTAWITSAEDSAVTVVDAAQRSILGRIEVGEGASALSASDAAARLYIAHEHTGVVTIVDTARREVAGVLRERPGITRVAFEPKGRFAFAVNPAANAVSILDASTGKVARALEGFAAPDAVTFTDAFAYVRSRGAPKISLLDLASLDRSGNPAIVDVPVGQAAPSDAPAEGGAPIAATPEGNSVIVASPADKALYFYVEGMMAPMGTHLNYGRQPRAVLVVDRTLKETAPGVYTTTVRLKNPGRYDVEILLDSPRLTACLSRDIEGEGARLGAERAPRLAFEPLFDPRVHLKPGEPRALHFRLREPGPSAPLDPQEVNVMVFRYPGNYQRRLSPIAAGGDDYEVTFTPPAPGQYRLLAGAPSRGAELGALPFVTLEVDGEEEER